MHLQLLSTLLLSTLLAPGIAAKKQKTCKLVPRSGILIGQAPLASPTSPAPKSGGSTTGTSSGGGSATQTLAAFDYQNKKVVGVNLGGWFVLEPWITPSMFINTGNDDIVDEFTFGKLQDSNTATTALTKHWQTWIVENDFITMAAAGINHVRIPFGYWSIPTGEPVAPYTPGAWPYLLQALSWAHKHGIYTIVDLHGAPGSQNGYDNSGQRTGDPSWALNPANISRTINDLVFLANGTAPLLDILELLNEPAGFLGSPWTDNIMQFWSDAYSAVRKAVGDDLLLMIGDAFEGVQSWNGFLVQSTGATGVLMDYHQYQIFSVPELQRSYADHITQACSLIPTLQTYAQHNLWTIMGEWSAASTDCAKWLNGRNVGARWDGTYSTPNQALGTCANVTGDGTTWSNEYKTFLRQYWEVQSVLGDAVNGNIWWTWKAENADEWDYSKGLQQGWIPQDPTERIYPNICG